MESSESSNNPFIGLLASPPEDANKTEPTPPKVEFKRSKVNNMVREIFYFTIDPSLHHAYYYRTVYSQLLFLEELSKSSAPQFEIDLELLEQALFERILLAEPLVHIIPKERRGFNEEVAECEVITYLFICERNLRNYLESRDSETVAIAKKMQELILRNAVTALRQPELFGDQILSDQIINLIKWKSVDCDGYINGIVNAFMSEDGPNTFKELKAIFEPILKLINDDIAYSKLMSIKDYVFPLMNLLSGNEYLADILLEVSSPSNPEVGRVYQTTLLGSLLNISFLPKIQGGKCDYFDSPLDKSASRMEEEKLWKSSEYLISNLHKIFLKLLKVSTRSKNALLEWISKCLHLNLARGRIWTSHVSHPALLSYVSDGFMMNLCTVLLLLCQPICTHNKWLMIDYTYCAVEEKDRESKEVHMYNMYKETCIIPPKEVFEDTPGPTRLVAAKPYTFITECFFLAHKALDIGFRVVTESVMKLSQELNQLRQTYAAALQTNPSSDMTAILDNKIKGNLTRLLSMRCALRDPQLITALTNFFKTTCKWLVQLALHPNETEIKDAYTLPKCLYLFFPLSDVEPDALRCIPEFIVENIVVFFTAGRHFKPQQNEELVDIVLSLVLVFMGSSKKMRNPHMRARLAECLAAMLPYTDNDHSADITLENFIRDRNFKNHLHRLEIVSSLLNVFVGIEVTGENVQFEQKFNYRRPMYQIMDYLWGIEEQQDCFKELAEEAEANMEAVTPPIFLRFVNLLMNDAVFLLDEALNNMSQIRTMQSIDEAELAQRTPNEREEHYQNLRYTGMLARFDNILGRHTIGTLEKLTSKISSVFCHPTMVNRIASMLNYFLLHLVGPKSKNFKVKDKEEFGFNPESTVFDICKIYIHLGEYDEFCAAVSQDGRSYRPDLFKFAENVLARIKGGGLISSLIIVAERVTHLARQQLLDEEVLADAPEEFLDPIMSTLMQDPVILPSSKINIDRTTIARHLLSDQSDPFNRSPLSMDQVTPNNELKSKIRDWIEQKRKEHKESSSS